MIKPEFNFSWVSDAPPCATCKQGVPDVPKSAAKEFAVYCSDRCRPSTPPDLLSVRGRFDSLKLRNR